MASWHSCSGTSGYRSPTCSCTHGGLLFLPGGDRGQLVHVPSRLPLPMRGNTAYMAVGGIQFGYCVSNIISKCGVGLIIVMVEHSSVWQLFPLRGITASYKVIAGTP